MFPLPDSLPIEQVLPEFLAAVRQHASVIVQAPPGAGKTTRIPPALLHAGVVEGRRVLVVQPRRVAARGTSRRMAEEWGCRLGDEVGYQIRFENRSSKKTRLLVVTEGILVQRLMDDPFLDDVGCVVIDEFHERHLETDLSLAMLKRVQQTVRPDLKLVVMSATLDPTPLQRYLNAAPVISCSLRSHPVEIQFQDVKAGQPLEALVAAGVEQLAGKMDGHILVFLPGVAEIRRSHLALQKFARESGALLLELFGDLSSSEQDRVFEDSPQRKIILATNIAETSITIPGVEGVVDSGLARQLEFNPATGLNRLTLKPISRASADQRSGRAGRTGPGVCLRLWSEVAQRIRPEFETAEVNRVELSGVVLRLMAWGETDLNMFPWFERPSEISLIRAEHVLRIIEAVDAQGITALGRRLAGLPLSPRLARLALDSAERGAGETGSLVAALLSERDVLDRRTGRSPRSNPATSDITLRLDGLRSFLATGRTDTEFGAVIPEAARRVAQVAEQIQRLLAGRKTDDRGAPTKNHEADIEAIHRALLASFPDRLVRRREPGSRRGLMVGGRGVELSPAATAGEAELFLAIDVDESGEQALVRIAAPISREWLSPALVQRRTVVEFDAVTARVQARELICWYDLILQQSPCPLPQDGTAELELVRAASENWSRVFPPEDPEVARLIARVQCLREWMPELDFPDWSERELQGLLSQLAMGCRSLSDLRNAPWCGVLQSTLTPLQRQSLEREAPDRITVPSGSRLSIDYAVGAAPVLAVRIQEIFGWKAAPRIAGGRVKLQFHLLAPNHRPQQITDDLPSFWSTAYPIIRGELRRRYPKHAWPEDPMNAVAQSKPTPRRKPGG